MLRGVFLARLRLWMWAEREISCIVRKFIGLRGAVVLLVFPALPDRISELLTHANDTLRVEAGNFPNKALLFKIAMGVCEGIRRKFFFYFGGAKPDIALFFQQFNHF